MQKLINKRSIVIDYLMMIVGTGLLAAAIQCLYDPIGLVTGGFTGLAIVIKAVTERFVPGGIPLWLTNIGLNVPLFFLTLKFKGKRFIWRTVVGTVLLSAWIYVIPAIDLTQQDYFLAAIFGGVIGGAGMGLILLARSTTGGTELLAVLIQHFIRHYSVVQIMQVLDAMIVLTGLYLFGIKAAMYAIVAGLYAKGMYSGDEKCMLYCVVSKKEIVELKDIVASVDPDAFVIVSDVREVLGEGFLEYHKN